MTHYAKIFFSSLIALALGFACGYLFSSKFCSISIGKRVEKISTLNHTLRKLLCNNVIWTHEYLKSTFFFIADKDAAEEKLSKNNQEIGAIIKAYYGTTAGQKVSEILDKQKPILNKAMAAVKFHDDAKNDLAKIASSLAEYLQELNPNWSNAPDFADSMITKTGSAFIQSMQEWHNKNWGQSLALFENNLDLSRASADELDRAITQQFPHKF